MLICETLPLKENQLKHLQNYIEQNYNLSEINLKNRLFILLTRSFQFADCHTEMSLLQNAYLDLV